MFSIFKDFHFNVFLFLFLFVFHFFHFFHSMISPHIPVPCQIHFCPSDITWKSTGVRCFVKYAKTSSPIPWSRTATCPNAKELTMKKKPPHPIYGDVAFSL